MIPVFLVVTPALTGIFDLFTRKVTKILVAIVTLDYFYLTCIKSYY